jgi:hypothetical protein
MRDHGVPRLRCGRVRVRPRTSWVAQRLDHAHGKSIVALLLELSQPMSRLFERHRVLALHAPPLARAHERLGRAVPLVGEADAQGHRHHAEHDREDCERLRLVRRHALVAPVGRELAFQRLDACACGLELVAKAHRRRG